MYEKYAKFAEKKKRPVTQKKPVWTVDGRTGKSVREQKVEEKREENKEKKFQTGPKFQKSKKEVNAYQKPLKNIGLHPPPKKEELRLKKSPQKKEQDLDLVPVKLLP